MKTIDIHTHLSSFDIYHEDYIYGMVEDSNLNISKEKFLKFSKVLLSDVDGSKAIKKMDQAGIRKSILLIVDSEIRLGENDQLTLDEIYLKHSTILKKYPERYIVFGGIDPRRLNAFEFIKRGYYEFNFRGVKLYPSFGFPMSHENLSKIYQFCSTHKIPVLLHTGPSINIINNTTYSDPENILEVCEKYSCNFILAHAGFKLDQAKVSDLLKFDNVYFDISGFQQLDFKDDKVIEKMTLIFHKKYSDKILFGTDWPLFHTMNDLRKDIKIINDVFSKSVKILGKHHDHDGLSKVMYKNAEKILKI